MGLTVPLKLAVLRRLVNSVVEADLIVSGYFALAGLLIIAEADEVPYRCC